MNAKRIIIYPKDVQLITGKSERAGRALLAKIKKANTKNPHQFVSINEFSEYTGLSVEEIASYLKD
jgi:hypothetical protein